VGDSATVRAGAKLYEFAPHTSGTIRIDANTTLSDVPQEAWAYKLANRSALEWVLDQYKEQQPRDPTIKRQFNSYRFADYKEEVIEMLCRVTTVSVETQKIIMQMPQIPADGDPV
jgi:predicted helicase